MTVGLIFAAVVELFPYFLAHTISCGIIALDGAGHHRKFSVTRRFDGGVVWITMVLLLLIAFLPFPTSLLSNYPGRIVPVALYASVVSAISLVQFWLWSHTYRRVFFDERIDFEEDWDLWFRLMEQYGVGAFQKVDQPLCYYWVQEQERREKPRLARYGDSTVRDYFRQRYGANPESYFTAVEGGPPL